MQQFELFLSNLILKFTIMAFSEAWLNCTNHTLFSIDGYNCESAHRSSRRGGGVSLYIKEHIGYKQRSDLDIFNEIMESKFIEIDKKYAST